MQLQLSGNSPFATIRATLGSNEQVKANSGAMIAMSSDVRLESGAEGGIGAALKRGLLGGQSFFINTFIGGPNGGFVDFAPTLSGDIKILELQGKTLHLQSAAWLCSDAGITLDPNWEGFKNLFGGEGGFMNRVTGQGSLAFSTYGALLEWDLQAGQSIVVDSGCMVAYEEGVQYELRKVSQSLVTSFIKSGEGLVYDFRGPGKVWVQTRNMDQLIGEIAARMPSPSGGSSDSSSGFSFKL